jgi:hypothetical protein
MKKNEKNEKERRLTLLVATEDQVSKKIHVPAQAPYIEQEWGKCLARGQIKAIIALGNGEE